MKLVTSLLLGSAAGLLAVASSQAADLPYRKAAPIAYIKVCDAYGVGYFYIPGTDTCLRVGGYVLFEEIYVSAPSYAFNSRIAGFKNVFGRGRDTTGDYTRARLTLDSRTATGYGTLRAVASVDVNLKHGVIGESPASVDFDKAYIQWAGITAGNVESFFDFFDDYFNYRDTFGTDNNPNLLAYTATFGGGFTATLSLESQRAMTTGFFDENAAAPALQDGYRVPDVIGQLNVTQTWGSAQLSGAAHEQRVSDIAGKHFSDYGYAGLAGVNIKLPSLAAGDQMWLEGSAGQGALQYAYGGVSGRYYTMVGGFSSNNSSPGAFAVDTNGFGDYDGVLLNGTQKMPTWYHFTAAFQHFFSPQVDLGLFGSYVDVKYPSAVNNFGSEALGLVVTSWNEFDVGGQLNYHPVPGLTFGAELIYSRLHNKIPKDLLPFDTSDIDAFTGTLHFERDF